MFNFRNPNYSGHTSQKAQFYFQHTPSRGKNHQNKTTLCFCFLKSRVILFLDNVQTKTMAGSKNHWGFFMYDLHYRLETTSFNEDELQMCRVALISGPCRDVCSLLFLRPHTYLYPRPFSLSSSSSSSHLTVGWVWTVSALKGLCVGPLRVLSSVASCVSHKRSEEPEGAEARR